MKTLAELGETGIIDHIRTVSSRSLPDHVFVGIGDDCAVLRHTEDTWLLVTMDTLVEGVHFTEDTLCPEDLGWKTLAVNISDIAAMGGTPTAAILSIGAGSKEGFSFMKAFIDGLQALASQTQIPLVGGDTVESPKSVVLTVTLLGTCPKNHLVLRSGAKTGDHIWVSGPVGSSAAGLHLLLKKSPPPPVYTPLILCHQRPKPRLVLGKALGQSGLVHAMIDLSDGIAKDLRHICTESKKGAVVQESAVPIVPEVLQLAAEEKKDPLAWALCGGEDYELLFTAPPSRHDDILALCASIHVDTPIHIGSIVEGDTVYLESAGTRAPLPDKGYHHFSSP